MLKDAFRCSRLPGYSYRDGQIHWISFNKIELIRFRTINRNGVPVGIHCPVCITGVGGENAGFSRLFIINGQCTAWWRIHSGTQVTCERSLLPVSVYHVSGNAGQVGFHDIPHETRCILTEITFPGNYFAGRSIVIPCTPECGYALLSPAYEIIAYAGYALIGRLAQTTSEGMRKKLNKIYAFT